MKRIFSILCLMAISYIYANEPYQSDSIAEEQNDSLIISRKGLHVGFYIVPGLGMIKGEETHSIPLIIDINYNYSQKFGLAAGGDLLYYFNQILGIKTGLGFQYLTYSREGTVENYDEYLEINNYRITNIAIPVQLAITTGKINKVGLYLNAGFIFCFPVNSSYTYTLDQNIGNSWGDVSLIDKTSNVVTSFASAIGLNIPLSKSININIAGFAQLGLTNFYTFDSWNGLRFYGVQIGLSYKTKN